MCAHSAKSFFQNHSAPSNDHKTNAAGRTKEEEKAVTAAEVAAPDENIVRAPDVQ